MQVTVRSYLMAGLAATGITALAVAPLPSMSQNVTVPSVEASVDLAAAPTLAQWFADTTGLAVGGFSSASAASAFLGTDTLGAALLGQGLLALVQADPSLLPIAALGGVGAALALPQATDLQFFGVTDSGVIPGKKKSDPLTYSLPGIPDTTSTTALVPVFTKNMPIVVGPISAATNNLATDIDDASDSVGGPKLAGPLTSGAQAVGTSVVQAQGLVRSATVDAVTNVAAASLSGNPQAVGTAIQTGAGGIQKSIVGDSSVPLVNPATGKVDSNSNLNTAAPVKRLGAIGTVSSTVQKAASNVGNALTN
jgi:hypothetical protein